MLPFLVERARALVPKVTGLRWGPPGHLELSIWGEAVHLRGDLRKHESGSGWKEPGKRNQHKDTNTWASLGSAGLGRVVPLPGAVGAPTLVGRVMPAPPTPRRLHPSPWNLGTYTSADTACKTRVLGELSLSRKCRGWVFRA